MTVVRVGQNVPLTCSCKNTSANVTYSLFWGKRYLESKTSREGAVVFHLKISSVNETGPYKCKANARNVSKYSPEFNFTIASKRITIQWMAGGWWDSLLWCEEGLLVVECSHITQEHGKSMAPQFRTLAAGFPLLFLFYLHPQSSAPTPQTGLPV